MRTSGTLRKDGEPGQDAAPDALVAAVDSEASSETRSLLAGPVPVRDATRSRRHSAYLHHLSLFSAPSPSTLTWRYGSVISRQVNRTGTLKFQDHAQSPPFELPRV